MINSEMIGSKTYYEIYIKGKSQKEINQEFNKLKKEIKDLKTRIANNEVCCYYPDYNTQLICNEDYLKYSISMLIVNEIKGLPKGTIFTIKQFLDKFEVDQDFQLRFDYTSIIKTEIKEIAEIYEEDKNAFIGPSFVFRYVKI